MSDIFGVDGFGYGSGNWMCTVTCSKCSKEFKVPAMANALAKHSDLCWDCRERAIANEQLALGGRQ